MCRSIIFKSLIHMHVSPYLEVSGVSYFREYCIMVNHPIAAFFPGTFKNRCNRGAYSSAFWNCWHRKSYYSISTLALHKSLQYETYSGGFQNRSYRKLYCSIFQIAAIGQNYRFFLFFNYFLIWKDPIPKFQKHCNRSTLSQHSQKH